jgi:two-component system, OmpR family, lantibiotic biosynthesis sensor histidine kinase NisK/SpaK
MDWIDEKIEIFNKWLRNLSLRKSLIVYIILCVIAVVSLYAFTVFICEKQEDRLWSKYTQTDELMLGSKNWVASIQEPSVLTGTDRIYVNIIQTIMTWSIVIYSICGIIGVSLLFYHKKLKSPLQILKEATGKVADSDLEIELYYDSKDEMGDLCRSFDFMRKQLINNNQKMWDIMGEQKRLNAAFAHDLRTPLTVLRGYTDFLGEYLPQGKVSEEKLLATLSMMTGHIARLESYCNTMKEIHSFEDIPVRQSEISMRKLMDKVEELVKIFNGQNNVKITINDTNTENQGSILIDEAIFMEVFENLMTNALRYAKSEIRVVMMLLKEEHQLLLSVADDGKGFSSVNLTMATEPYYSDSPKNQSEHYGIGLYLCKLLCEKHGGWISLSNGILGGAVVTTTYCVTLIEKNKF